MMCGDIVCRLLTVKSLVTLILTVVCGILALRGEVCKDFMTIYTVVITFYFSAQTGNKNRKN